MKRIIILLLGVALVLGQGPLQDCRCINIYKCNSFMNLLRRFGTSASGFIKDAHCGFEGNEPKVCCPDPPEQVDHEPTRPPQNPNNYPNRPNNPPNRQPGNTNPFLTQSPFAPIPGLQKLNPAERANCGYSDAEHTRIVGGVASKPGAWPWIAELGYKQPGTLKPNWQCGGSLISDRHVLTAAHCVRNTRAELYLVRLGEHNLADENDGANPIDVKVIYKNVHPGYSTTTFVNDIAVLTLEHPVNFTDKIHPVCLPLTADILNLDMTGYHPFVAGWGTVSYRGLASDVLREVQVEVQPVEVCRNSYQKLSPNVAIDERIICAGYKVGGKDACQGDSGGPLMLPKPDGSHYWYLIGLVSYGHRCAEPNFPGVYTRTGAHLDFIYNVVTQTGGQWCDQCGLF